MENDCPDLPACRGCLVQFICFQDLAGRYSSTKSSLSTTRTPSHWAKWNSIAWEVLAWLCFESWHTLGHAMVKDVPEGLILPSNNHVEYHRKPRSSLLLRSLLQDRHVGREKQWQGRLWLGDTCSSQEQAQDAERVLGPSSTGHLTSGYRVETDTSPASKHGDSSHWTTSWPVSESTPIDQCQESLQNERRMDILIHHYTTQVNMTMVLLKPCSPQPT